jgi:nucleoside-diphosphate-sugar epimerase
LRVAVTGGSGRVGRFVVRELVARGHQVVNLDRKQPAESCGRFVFLDLSRRELVQPVLEQVDAVCHLGELPGVGGMSPDETYARNTAAGAVVMQTAADLKLKRVIYTSTVQVYGCWGPDFGAPRFLPMDETHPLLPNNAYSAGKVANEVYARMISERHGISVAIFRLPGMQDYDLEKLDQQSHVFHWLTHSTGRCEGMATYLHAADAARAYALAVENPRPGCEAYHFTAPEVFSCVPIRERMLKHNPENPPLPSDWPAFKSPVITEKARQHFGWVPQVNVLDIYRKKFGRDPQPE